MIRKYQHCLECGAPLESGRTDKKFCSLHCKNLYNNSHNETSYHRLKTKTLAILNKNHRILSDLMSSNITSIDLGDLVAEGFNPEYSTSYKKANGGDELRCFDIKYRLSGLRVFNIKSVKTVQKVADSQMVDSSMFEKGLKTIQEGLASEESHPAQGKVYNR